MYSRCTLGIKPPCKSTLHAQRGGCYTWLLVSLLHLLASRILIVLQCCQKKSCARRNPGVLARFAAGGPACAYLKTRLSGMVTVVGRSSLKERERIKSIYDVSSLARDVMAQLLHLSLFGVGANYWTHYTGLAGCFVAIICSCIPLLNYLLPTRPHKTRTNFSYPFLTTVLHYL